MTMSRTLVFARTHYADASFTNHTDRLILRFSYLSYGLELQLLVAAMHLAICRPAPEPLRHRSKVYAAATAEAGSV